MEIQILQLIEGARRARGLTVIIDVFRAFTTACYAFGNGAEEIICVGDVDEAFSLKKEDPERILMGERNERMVEGFRFGNSPSQVESADLRGKTLIQTTSAGTRGMVGATGADEIITGSFVNAGAIIRHIRDRDPALVSLVCMGYAARKPIEEDTLCAEYISKSLQGMRPDFDPIAEKIRNTSGRRFFIAENQDFAPSTDFYMCLDLDRFNFALCASPFRPGMLSLKPVYK